MSVESERRVAEALGVEVADRVDGGGSGREVAGKDTVRLVAGQREKVNYPEATEQTGQKRNGGDRSDLVSVAGLENRRSFKGLNQSELARRSGVGRGTINKIEKQTGRATRKTARMLAGALGVGVEELAEAEQRSRFPERQSTAVTYSEEDTISCTGTQAAKPHVATDSSPATDEEESGTLRVELSEPVLRRVDRFLDLLESALRPRRA